MTSNANTSGLEACPFCGGEAWLNDYEAKYSDLPPKSRCPQCRSCGASLGYLPTPAKATEAWNRRVTAASAQARIAELERALEKTASDFREAAEAHAAAEARADRLAKALEPFALASLDRESQNAKTLPGGASVRVTLAQCRAARQARAALQQEG